MFFRTAFFVLLAKLFGALVTLILTAYITRYFGASDSGVYFFCLSSMMLFVPLSSFGFENLTLKKASLFLLDKNDKTFHKYMTLTVLTVSLISFILVLIIYFGIDLIGLDFEQTKKDVIHVLVFIIPLSSMISILSSAVQGIGYVPRAFILSGPIITTLTLVAIWLIKSDDVLDLARVYVYVLLLVMAYLGWFLYKKNCLHFSIPMPLKGLLPIVIPLLIIQLVSQVNAQMGQVLLGFIANSNEVAYFNVAIKVSLTVSFVLLALNKTLSGEFAKLFHDSDIESLAKLISKSIKILMITVIPIIAFLFIFSDYILGFFGSEFVNASIVLKILLIGQLVNVLTGSVGMLLQMTGHERDMQKVTLFSTLIAIIIGFPFCYFFQAVGASLMISFNLIVINLWCVYLVKKHIGINTLTVWYRK